MDEEWQYTAQALAAELGISVAAVYKAVEAGHLPRRYQPIAKPPRGNRYMLVFTTADADSYRRDHLGRWGRPQSAPDAAPD